MNALARTIEPDMPPAIPQPEPGLTADEVIRRAEAMIPMLRAQQDEADERGHFSDEVLQAFIDAGFYRILLPKMFGGYEFGVDTFLQVVRLIARGHPSSGWCFCLSASHCAVVASHWPEEAQRALFGETGDFRSPHRAVPGGSIRRVDGGYRISGTWTYSSGIPVSTHFAGNVLEMREGAPPVMQTFFVPREQVTILDDWGGDAGLGMQGSGSNSVVLDDVFVPELHVAGGDHLFGQHIAFAVGTPGTQLHGNPFYLGIFGGVYHLCFTAIFVGAAQAAMDEFEALSRTAKVFGKPGATLAGDGDTHRVVGEAAMLIDGAEAILQVSARQGMALFERWGETRAPITPQETMRIWAMGRQAAKMATSAIEMLFHAATPVASRRGQKLQRYVRDAHMYLVHPSSQPWVVEARGQAQYGLPISKFAPPAAPKAA